MMTNVLNTEYKGDVKDKHIVFIFDNDECIGAWTLASSIHGVFSDYVPKATGIPVSDCLRVCRDSLVKHYFPNGGARPGTKETLQLVKFYKDLGKIDRVVMFTSAPNANEWVHYLKGCLEQYSGVEGLYDLVLHKGNVEVKIAKDGATLKCLDTVLERLNLPKENTKIVMVDDRPHNIRGGCVRVAVSAYRHIINASHIEAMIDETLGTLQEIYRPVYGKKTYPPKMLSKMLKHSFLVDVNGIKKDISDNINIYNCPVDQLDDTNLMVEGTKAFLDHLEPDSLIRSTTVNQLFTPTLPLVRGVSV
jgi:hypothetical protein